MVIHGISSGTTMPKQQEVKCILLEMPNTLICTHTQDGSTTLFGMYGLGSALLSHHSLFSFQLTSGSEFSKEILFGMVSGRHLYHQCFHGSSIFKEKMAGVFTDTI